MNSLEKMLDAQCKREFHAKAKAAETQFGQSYPNTSRGILSTNIKKDELLEYIRQQHSTSITVRELMDVIHKHYWTKHEATITQKAKDSLIRDMKVLAELSKDYFD